MQGSFSGNPVCYVSSSEHVLTIVVPVLIVVPSLCVPIVPHTQPHEHCVRLDQAVDTHVHGQHP